ncbi:MAG: polymer-forming cytoskeletal protein [Chthoniobacter sp.]|nr:polymer-forming cytoskeletal protein [Chthoniobacter sp.]
MNPPTNRSSTILNDVEITGTITFQGELSFDGQLHEGEIIGEHLVVGPTARIEGNIQVATLILHGSVIGNVLVTDRCKLTGTANLVGGLTTNRLAMDDGATLIGNAEITPDTKARPPLPKDVSVSTEFPPGLASLKAQVQIR